MFLGGAQGMALRGTNQEFGRPYNRRIVLESIRLLTNSTIALAW